MTEQKPFSVMASEHLDKGWIKSGGFRAQFRNTPAALETAHRAVAQLNAHDELVKALEPFAEIARVLGDKPPQGTGDTLHEWQLVSGTAVFRHSDCLKALAALNALKAS